MNTERQPTTDKEIKDKKEKKPSRTWGTNLLGVVLKVFLGAAEQESTPKRQLETFKDRLGLKEEDPLYKLLVEVRGVVRKDATPDEINRLLEEFKKWEEKQDQEIVDTAKKIFDYVNQSDRNTLRSIVKKGDVSAVQEKLGKQIEETLKGSPEKAKQLKQYVVGTHIRRTLELLHASIKEETPTRTPREETTLPVGEGAQEIREEGAEPMAAGAGQGGGGDGNRKEPPALEGGEDHGEDEGQPPPEDREAIRQALERMRREIPHPERIGALPPEEARQLNENPLRWINEQFRKLEQLVDPRMLSERVYYEPYRNLLEARVILDRESPELSRQISARLKGMMAELALRASLSAQELFNFKAVITEEDLNTVFRMKNLYTKRIEEEEQVREVVCGTSEYLEENAHEIPVVARAVNIIHLFGPKYAMTTSAQERRSIQEQMCALLEAIQVGVVRMEDHEGNNFSLKRAIAEAIEQNVENENERNAIRTRAQDDTRAEQGRYEASLGRALTQEERRGLFEKILLEKQIEKISLLVYRRRYDWEHDDGAFDRLREDEYQTALNETKKAVFDQQIPFLRTGEAYWRVLGEDVYADPEAKTSNYGLCRIHNLPEWVMRKGAAIPIVLKTLFDGRTQWLRIDGRVSGSFLSNLLVKDVVQNNEQERRLGLDAVGRESFVLLPLYKDVVEDGQRKRSIATDGGKPLLLLRRKTAEDGPAYIDKTNSLSPRIADLTSIRLEKIDFSKAGVFPLAPQADQEMNIDEMRKRIVGREGLAVYLSWDKLMEVVRSIAHTDDQKEIGEIVRMFFDVYTELHTKYHKQLGLKLPTTRLEIAEQINVLSAMGYLTHADAAQLTKKHVGPIWLWQLLGILVKDAAPVIVEETGKLVRSAAEEVAA